MPKPVLVFDLDGTLADTSLDLIPALNRTTATRGLPPVPAADVSAVVGHGARAMIARAYAFHATALEQQIHDELFDLFLDDYEQNIAVHTVLFEGASAVIDHFSEEGFVLAVCTNKPQRLALKLLEELGVRTRFAAITGGDTYPWRKPDPRHLLGTVELAGGNSANAIMIGDSRTDIDTAKAAGMPVIAVDFGYTDMPVQTFSPDIVISRFDELPRAVQTILGNQARQA